METSVTPQQLEQIISNLLVANTQVVNQATDSIVKLLRHPEITIPLMNIFMNHPRVEMRQITGVLLRKKICALWIKLPPNVHDQITTTLIQIVNTCDIRAILLTTAQIIKSIAKITVPIDKWPNLLPTILQWTQSPNDLQKEVALRLVADVAGYYLNMPNNGLMFGLFQLVGSTLSTSQNFKIKKEAINILSVLSQFIEKPSDLAPFEQLTPLIANTMKDCIKLSDEDDFCDLVEVLSSIVEGFSEVQEFDTMTQKTMSPILALCLETAGIQSLPAYIRQSALYFINTFVEYQLEYSVSSGIVPPLTQLLINILSEYNPLDPEDEEAPHRIYAGEVLSTMAEILPSSDFFPLFWDIVSKNLESTAPGIRCAVSLALGTMSFTCPVSINEVGNIISPYILTSLQNENISVKGSALTCIGNFADNSVAFIYTNCDMFFSTLLALTKDSNVDLQSAAFFDIHIMVEKLSLEEMKNSVGPLLNRCIEVVLSTPDYDVRDAALATLSALVFLAGELIIPHAQPIIQIANQLIVAEVHKDIEIIQKGRGIELFGCIAKAIGKDAFRPYLEAVVNIIRQMLVMKHTFEYEIRKFSYSALSDLFSVYGSELAPLIPMIIERLINTFQMEDDDDEKKEQLGNISSDDEDDEEEEHISYSSGLVDEKGRGAILIGKMFESVPREMETYGIALLGFLNKMCADDRIDVADCACETLWKILYIPLVKEGLYNPLGQNPTGANAMRLVNEGTLTKVQLTLESLPQSVMATLKEVTETYFLVSDNTKYRDILITILNQFIEIFTLLGTAGAHFCIVSLSNLTLKILNQQTKAQKQNLGFDPSEIHEAESDLLSTVGDVLMMLFKMFGKNVSDYFVQLFAILSKISQKRNNSAMKSTAIGVIADFFVYSNFCPEQIIDPALALFLHNLTSNNEDVTINAACGFGSLVRIIPQSHSQSALNASQQALQIIATRIITAKRPGVIDNFVSCVCKILCVPGCPFQPQAILPQLIRFLPITSDHEEEENVYSTFAKFYINIPELNAQKSLLIDAFRKALNVEGVRDSTKQLLQKYLM